MCMEVVKRKNTVHYKSERGCTWQAKWKQTWVTLQKPNFTFKKKGKKKKSEEIKPLQSNVKTEVLFFFVMSKKHFK